MKRCPSCRKFLPDDEMLVCPYDGTPLLETQTSPDALADTIEDERGKSASVHPTKSRAPSGRPSRWLVVCIATFVLIAGLSLTIFIIKRNNPSSCSENIKITTPINLQRVDILIPVRGTYQDLPAGQEIWILVYPLEVGKYYPQDQVEYLDNNRWSSSATIGLNGEKGKSFYIYAVLADKQAQQVLKDYTEQAKNTNDSPGMPELVEGARICTSVTVTRK